MNHQERLDPKRVLITGDRHWTDTEAIARYIKTLGPGTVVIHGACPTGADTMAGELAERRALKVEAYPADWKRYRLGAGPKRNQQMLDEGRPDLVVYFHNNLQASKGTKDMVARAVRAGVAVLNGAGPGASDSRSPA
jgi:hypothetical protein